MKGKVTTKDAILYGIIGVLVVGWVIPRVPFVRRLTQNQALSLRQQIQDIYTKVLVTDKRSITTQEASQIDDLMGRLNAAGYNVMIEESNNDAGFKVVLGTTALTNSII